MARRRWGSQLVVGTDCHPMAAASARSAARSGGGACSTRVTPCRRTPICVPGRFASHRVISGIDGQTAMHRSAQFLVWAAPAERPRASALFLPDKRRDQFGGRLPITR